MPNWLFSIAKLFTILINFVKDAWLIKTGKDLQVGADSKRALEIKNEQLQTAANDTPTDRDDLIRRLRDPKDGL